MYSRPYFIAGQHAFIEPTKLDHCLRLKTLPGVNFFKKFNIFSFYFSAILISSFLNQNSVLWLGFKLLLLQFITKPKNSKSLIDIFTLSEHACWMMLQAAYRPDI